MRFAHLDCRVVSSTPENDKPTQSEKGVAVGVALGLLSRRFHRIFRLGVCICRFARVGNCLPAGCPHGDSRHPSGPRTFVPLRGLGKRRPGQAADSLMKHGFQRIAQCPGARTDMQAVANLSGRILLWEAASPLSSFLLRLRLAPCAFSQKQATQSSAPHRPNFARRHSQIRRAAFPRSEKKAARPYRQNFFCSRQLWIYILSLRLTIPTRPIRPVPRSPNVPGSGMTAIVCSVIDQFMV